MVLYYFMILWQVRLGFLDRKKIMLGFDCSNYFGFKRPYFRGSVHRKHPVSILFHSFTNYDDDLHTMNIAILLAV